MAKSFPKMNMVLHSKSSFPLFFHRTTTLIFSPHRSQILIIKDLRQSDAGNYTCELFNSFGAINATYILQVTGKERIKKEVVEEYFLVP